MLVASRQWNWNFWRKPSSLHNLLLLIITLFIYLFMCAWLQYFLFTINVKLINIQNKYYLTRILAEGTYYYFRRIKQLHKTYELRQVENTLLQSAKVAPDLRLGFEFQKGVGNSPCCHSHDFFWFTIYDLWFFVVIKLNEDGSLVPKHVGVCTYDSFMIWFYCILIRTFSWLIYWMTPVLHSTQLRSVRNKLLHTYSGWW
jgi:hypothetical protein